MTNLFFTKQLTTYEDKVNFQVQNGTNIPRLIEVYKESELKFGKFEYIQGQTIYKCLLKSGIWPYHTILEFNSKFLELIDLLINMARYHNFRHNDIHPKNIMIDNNKCLRLVDLGLSQTDMYNYPKFPKHFIRRNHSIGQLKTFYFRKLPADYSYQIYSLHNGLITELDITNLINLYGTIIYMKYPENIKQLDSIKDYISYFNSNNNYPDKLEKLKYIFIIN